MLVGLHGKSFISVVVHVAGILIEPVDHLLERARAEAVVLALSVSDIVFVDQEHDLADVNNIAPESEAEKIALMRPQPYKQAQPDPDKDQQVTQPLSSVCSHKSATIAYNGPSLATAAAPTR